MSDVHKVDFSGLVLGFSSAVLHYLGHSSIEGETSEVNLPLARQNLDILNLLKEKTKGNLSSEEDKLITHVLQDLKAKIASFA